MLGWNVINTHILIWFIPMPVMLKEALFSSEYYIHFKDRKKKKRKKERKKNPREITDDFSFMRHDLLWL